MSRHQKSRRPDSASMWEEQDRKAPIPSRERDEPRRDDRSGRGRDDRDFDRRRYRSRSPRGAKDDRRDQHRGGRDGRGMDRDRERDYRSGGRHDRERGEYAKDVRRDRERERERDGDRGMSRIETSSVHKREVHTDVVSSERTYKDRREQSRSRSKERTRDNIRRDNRSQSPRIEPQKSEEPERPRSSRFDNDLTKSRTSTPPVAFKVGTPQAFDDDHMDVDHHTKKGGAKNIKMKKDKAPVKEESSDEEVIVEEDDSMGDMAAMMGFGGFGTTQNQKVDGNNIGGVRKEKKTEYRQYMNRVGGFNRPLSPPK